MPKISPAHEQQRRAQILAAAMACFARQGYHATSMDDVVRESGLSVGAIYSYFPSKEDLFLTLCEDRVEQTLAYMNDLFARPGCIAEKSREAVDYFFDRLSDELVPLARVNVEFLSEALKSERIKERQERRFESIRQFFNSLLSAAQQRGELRADVDIRAAAELMMALNEGIVLLSVTGLRRVPLEALKVAYLALLDTGLASPDHSLFPSVGPANGAIAAAVVVPRNGTHLKGGSGLMPRRRNFGPLLAGGALASVLLLSACGQKPSAAPAAAPTPVPASPVTAQTATRGLIQQTLSYSGDIRAREQVSVLPKNSGRVERILVDVGSKVKAGDTIATLEQESAQISALQARATLAGAEAKLASLQVGPKADDVAAAEAALSQQQVHLESMQSGGRDEDIQLAQAALTAQQAKLDLMVQGGRPEAIQQAQDAVDSANAKLTALEKGATNDIKQAAQSAVDSDQAALASAEAAYAALGGNNAADKQAAQSQVDTLTAGVQAAQAAVSSADAAMANLQGTAPADVQQAQSAFDQAQAQLKSAQAALTQGFNPTQASIAQAQAAVAQAQAGLHSAEANQTGLEQGVSPPCADTQVSATLKINHNGTACGDAKAAADAAVQSANAAVEAAQGQLDLLKRGGSPAAQAQLQAAVDTAQSSVSATKLRLYAVKNGGIDAQRAQLQAGKEQAQSQLLAGQQNLIVAQARLTAINNGTQDAQVKNAASQVTASRERLKSDQAKLDQLNGGPTDEDLQQAHSAVDQAAQQLTLAVQPSTQQDIRAQSAAVEQARLQLVKARAPFTDYDLQQQQQAVAQAEANLRLKQNPYTDQDLASAQAVVDQSKAQLGLAEIGVKDTTIVAPADGAISERLVSPGALVSPQTPIVTLVPPSLELVVNVEERQLGQVAEGQSVQLSVPAFPQQTFTGAVKSIAPTVDSKSRTAAVRIEPKDDGSRLRAGMFAQLSIVTAEKQNALIVPKQAVLVGTPGTEPLVITIDPAGRVHRQPVRLGLQSDSFDEILTGIDDGQLVATSSLSDLTDGDIVAPQVDTRTAMR